MFFCLSKYVQKIDNYFKYNLKKIIKNHKKYTFFWFTFNEKDDKIYLEKESKKMTYLVRQDRYGGLI